MEPAADGRGAIGGCFVGGALRGFVGRFRFVEGGERLVVGSADAGASSAVAAFAVVSDEDGLAEWDVAGGFLCLCVELLGSRVQLFALACKMLGSRLSPLESVLFDVCGRSRCGVELDRHREAGLLQCLDRGVDDVGGLNRSTHHPVVEACG